MHVYFLSYVHRIFMINPEVHVYEQEPISSDETLSAFQNSIMYALEFWFFFHTATCAQLRGKYLITQINSDTGRELPHLQMKNISS